MRTYRIELEKINKKFSFEDKTEYVYSSAEVKTFLAECVEEGYRVIKIVRCTKDGKGTDVTKNYIK